MVIDDHIDSWTNIWLETKDLSISPNDQCREHLLIISQFAESIVKTLYKMRETMMIMSHAGSTNKNYH